MILAARRAFAKSLALPFPQRPPAVKRSSLFIAGLFVLLVLGGIIFYLQQQLYGPRRFEVKGRVAGFSDDARTVFVEHEPIPGYMPAMTMPLSVRDTALVSDLRGGDAIRFQLRVDGDQAWMAAVEKLPARAVAQHPAGGNEPLPAARTAEASEIVQVGEAAPEAALTAQSGAAVRLSDYHGKALVLTFIYTSCPLPDFCPLMSRRFAQLQPRLEDAFGDRAQLLSVSFDPATDTPAVLKDYAARYTDDLSNWTFATGTPAQIEDLTARFGVFTRQEGGQITHNLTTALVGPEGRVRQIWRGNDWSPGDVVQAAREALGASEAAS